MKLFCDPISTTSRPVLLFLAEHRMKVEIVETRLMEGAHLAPDYAALNPNKCVPTLVDTSVVGGDFALTEASAILKYLADKSDWGGSPAYPHGLKARARVNQAMDWLNTGFYRDFGCGLVYPQVFPQYVHANATTQADTLKRATEKSGEWLAILNDHWLARGAYLCGREATIADYLGAAYVSIGDWIGFDLSPYPNVSRWLDAMRGRPSWAKTHAPWAELTAYFRNQPQLQSAA